MHIFDDHFIDVQSIFDCTSRTNVTERAKLWKVKSEK